MTSIRERAVSFTEQQGVDTGPIPVAAFSSEAYYQREIERIFKRVWLPFGWLHDIPRPGDYFVKEIPFAGSSVIVVRGQNGEVRAFHNVCFPKVASLT